MLDGEERTSEVGPENSVPIFQGGQVDRATTTVTSVGHNHGQLASRIRHCTRVRHTFFTCDITCHSQNLSATFGDRSQFFSCRLKSFNIARSQDDCRRILNKFTGATETDSRSPSCNECNLADKRVGIMLRRHHVILAQSLCDRVNESNANRARYIGDSIRFSFIWRPSP